MSWKSLFLNDNYEYSFNNSSLIHIFTSAFINNKSKDTALANIHAYFQTDYSLSYNTMRKELLNWYRRNKRKLRGAKTATLTVFTQNK